MTSRIDLVAQNGNIGHAEYLEMQERLKALAIAIPEWPATYVYDSVDLYDDGVEFRTKGEGEFDRYQWEAAREELIAVQKRKLNPPTSSLHHSQAVEMAKETGLCSDGGDCGYNTTYFGGYCDGCPNIFTEHNFENETALDSQNITENGFREKKSQHENHSAQPHDMVKRYPKYYKDVSSLSAIDVYAVHELFGINDSSGCIQHASKKLLLCGVRTGGKDVATEIKEARDTLTRKLQLMGVE